MALPKKIILWAIGLAFLVITIFFFNEYLQTYLNNQKKSRVSIVVKHAGWNKDKCSRGTPLYVTLKNLRVDDTIWKTTYSITIRRNGYSSDISDFSLKYLETDRIILPGKSVSYCIKIALKPQYVADYFFTNQEVIAGAGNRKELGETLKARFNRATTELSFRGRIDDVEFEK